MFGLEAERIDGEDVVVGEADPAGFVLIARGGGGGDGVHRGIVEPDRAAGGSLQHLAGGQQFRYGVRVMRIARRPWDFGPGIVERIINLGMIGARAVFAACDINIAVGEDIGGKKQAGVAGGGDG